MKIGQITNYAVWIGLLLMLLGFIYDVIFAGIPYQDAPPHLVDKYNQNRNIADATRAAGFTIFVVALLVKLIQYLISLLKK